MHSQPIILTTINARYVHSAFGLRYLWANLGALRDQAVLREFNLGQPPLIIAEQLLAGSPRLIGFGVYIWNVTPVTQVARTIKAICPKTVLVIGGPEVSYEYEDTELLASADYLVRGEGERSFAQLAQTLFDGIRPAEKVIGPDWPELSELTLPYDAYTPEDLAKRIIYVEASRGCPFECEFCLSSLDAKVREFRLETFLAEMRRLLDRGARRFKFVDRTFNLRPERVERILRFFLERWQEHMQLHFEIVPDRMPKPLLELLAQFPANGLHLEVGIQTFNPEAMGAISRRQDLEKTAANLEFLRQRTGAQIHADLIAGLPGESWESFAAGFDRLVALGPQEIQIGILKRLKGTPIARHVPARKMVFSPEPPYEILQTDLLDFGRLQRIKRFARYFDLYYNSGNFPESLRLLWQTRPSAFDAFMSFSDYLWAKTARTHEFPLNRLAEHLYDFLAQSGATGHDAIGDALRRDYHRVPGRKEKLHFSAT